MNLFFFFAMGMAKRVSRFPEMPTTALMMHQMPAKVFRVSSSLKA